MRRIPAGQVATYGAVATAAGLPRRARLVGTALRGCPADVPWHRVIAAPGRVAFPPGSDGYDEQCRRLQEEGVACVGGRIDLNRFGWQTDLDALLWGPAAWDNGENGRSGASRGRHSATAATDKNME